MSTICGIQQHPRGSDGRPLIIAQNSKERARCSLAKFCCCFCWSVFIDDRGFGVSFKMPFARRAKAGGGLGVPFEFDLVVRRSGKKYANKNVVTVSNESRHGCGISSGAGNGGWDYQCL